jgi:hypothetical protein
VFGPWFLVPGDIVLLFRGPMRVITHLVGDVKVLCTLDLTLVILECVCLSSGVFMEGQVKEQKP